MKTICIWFLFQSLFLPAKAFFLPKQESSSSSVSSSSSSSHRLKLPNGAPSSLMLSSMIIHMTADENNDDEKDDPTILSFYKEDEEEEIAEQPLHSSLYTQVLSTTLPIATDLRQAYDEHFADPREPNAARFAWDPWYVSVGDGKKQQQPNDHADNDNDKEQVRRVVPGEPEASAQQTQYSLKRIQTSLFFSEDLYDTLLEELIALGRSVGLTAITPPWTSMYTEGDLQNFHTDAPHGPLAFVLSLSNEGDFQGGETIMLQPQILDFWKGFDNSKGMECGSILRHIPPFPLGRCIAFDPRVPHGVNRVTGNGQNPQRARVVIHGWFNEPEACWLGPWSSQEEANALLDQVLQPLVEILGNGEIGRVVGYLAVRAKVHADGSVDQVRTVCDTLRADPEDFRGVIGYDEADRPVMEDAVADVRLSIFETLKDLNFGEGEEGRAVVVPFEFM